MHNLWLRFSVLAPSHHSETAHQIWSESELLDLSPQVQMEERINGECLKRMKCIEIIMHHLLDS